MAVGASTYAGEIWFIPVTLISKGVCFEKGLALF